jgi:hypothetical protein
MPQAVSAEIAYVTNALLDCIVGKNAKLLFRQKQIGRNNGRLINSSTETVI